MIRDAAVEQQTLPPLRQAMALLAVYAAVPTILQQVTVRDASPFGSFDVANGVWPVEESPLRGAPHTGGVEELVRQLAAIAKIADVDKAGARRFPFCIPFGEPELGDAAAQDLAVDQVEVGILVGVHVVPQHAVVGMQEDRCVDRVLERDPIGIAVERIAIAAAAGHFAAAFAFSR